VQACEPRFPHLHAFRPHLGLMFRTGLKSLDPSLSHFGAMFRTGRTDLGDMNRPGLKRLGMQPGPSRRRDDPVVEAFQGRFRDAAAAGVKRSHGGYPHRKRTARP